MGQVRDEGADCLFRCVFECRCDAECSVVPGPVAPAPAPAPASTVADAVDIATAITVVVSITITISINIIGAVAAYGHRVGQTRQEMRRGKVRLVFTHGEAHSHLDGRLDGRPTHLSIALRCVPVAERKQGTSDFNGQEELASLRDVARV